MTTTVTHTETAAAKVGIVVLSRNADLLRHHLDAHRLYSPGPDVARILVVDTSGSRQGDVLEAVKDFLDPAITAAALAEEETDEELLDVAETVKYLDRRGPAQGFYGNHVNAGARRAIELWKPEYLVFANDDTVPGPDWLPLMLSDFEGLKEKGGEPVGLLGARSNYVSGPQSVYDRTLLPYGINGETVFPYPRIVTFFAACRAADFEKVGGFDEALPAHNHSDDILSCRFLRGGFMNWVSRAFVFHAGSQTFARAGKTTEEARAFYEADMKRGEEYVLEHYPDASGLFGQTLQRCFPALPADGSQG